jgi:hypothetical protein
VYWTCPRLPTGRAQGQVITYYSKAVSKAGRNHCVTLRELLAVMKKFQHFHKNSYGQEFHPLQSVLAAEVQESGGVGGMLDPVSLEYSFTLEHCQGQKHRDTNVLSQRLCCRSS